MRIVFFGTPLFAVPSLDALVADGNEVVAVVTQPDRPRGRSHSTVVPCPVKTRAESLNIPVLQPDRPTGDLFLTSLKRLEPDLGVVVAYGHILRQVVLDVPRAGMINIHASLLPLLRGAAPITWSIVEGFEKTGITVMQMEAGLDSGPILHQVATPIDPDESAGELTVRLAVLGGTALADALALIRLGTIQPVPQDHARATYAPKIDRSTARIDWQQPAETIARRIRAFDPAPGAWTMLGSHALKCFRPQVVSGQGPAGTVLEAEQRLVLAAGSRAVVIREVQPAGRSRMLAEEWIRGRGVAAGDRMT
jgi:methionyl-tRNA formyltransferase